MKLKKKAKDKKKVSEEDFAAMRAMEEEERRRKERMANMDKELKSWLRLITMRVAAAVSYSSSSGMFTCVSQSNAVAHMIRNVSSDVCMMSHYM